MAAHRGKIDVEIAKALECDDFDVITEEVGANDRTLCGCVELTSRGVPEWDWGPYFPGGTVQVKVVDGAMANYMEFFAAVGHPCGPDFSAGEFLARHPEYAWMKGSLRDLKSGPWTRFAIGMK
jgi:hypothetical protein